MAEKVCPRCGYLNRENDMVCGVCNELLVRKKIKAEEVKGNKPEQVSLESEDFRSEMETADSIGAKSKPQELLSEIEGQIEKAITSGKFKQLIRSVAAGSIDEAVKKFSGITGSNQIIQEAQKVVDQRISEFADSLRLAQVVEEEIQKTIPDIIGKNNAEIVQQVFNKVDEHLKTVFQESSGSGVSPELVRGAAASAVADVLANKHIVTPQEVQEIAAGCLDRWIPNYLATDDFKSKINEHVDKAVNASIEKQPKTDLPADVNDKISEQIIELFTSFSQSKALTDLMSQTAAEEIQKHVSELSAGDGTASPEAANKLNSALSRLEKEVFQEIEKLKVLAISPGAIQKKQIEQVSSTKITQTLKAFMQSEQLRSVIVNTIRKAGIATGTGEAPSSEVIEDVAASKVSEKLDEFVKSEALNKAIEEGIKKIGLPSDSEAPSTEEIEETASKKVAEALDAFMKGEQFKEAVSASVKELDLPSGSEAPSTEEIEEAASKKAAEALDAFMKGEQFKEAINTSIKELDINKDKSLSPEEIDEIVMEKIAGYFEKLLNGEQLRKFVTECIDNTKMPKSYMSEFEKVASEKISGDLESFINSDKLGNIVTDNIKKSGILDSQTKTIEDIAVTKISQSLDAFLKSDKLRNTMLESIKKAGGGAPQSKVIEDIASAKISHAMQTLLKSEQLKSSVTETAKQLVPDSKAIEEIATNKISRVLGAFLKSDQLKKVIVENITQQDVLESFAKFFERISTENISKELDAFLKSEQLRSIIGDNVKKVGGAAAVPTGDEFKEGIKQFLNTDDSLKASIAGIVKQVLGSKETNLLIAQKFLDVMNYVKSEVPKLVQKAITDARGS
ncbi:MAG: hypothetical protein ABIH42_10285 [Planctomycetota bacterium]